MDGRIWLSGLKARALLETLRALYSNLGSAGILISCLLLKKGLIVWICIELRKQADFWVETRARANEKHGNGTPGSHEHRSGRPSSAHCIITSMGLVPEEERVKQ